MNEAIQAQLVEIEETEQVKILYACESGSRAWGFPSADSDYDVRFIYVRPRDWYLSVFDRRDVIERPVSELLDVNGWDLKKALQLMRKSNPPLSEWLGSPIVYRQNPQFAQKMRELAAACYSPVASIHHYLQMARGNFREYLKGDTVKVKKYFYVLRPILAAIWVEQGLGSAPTEFGKLVDKIVDDPALKARIEQFVEEKRTGIELDRGPRIPIIHDFLERQLQRLSDKDITFQRPATPDREIDEFFRSSIEDVWNVG